MTPDDDDERTTDITDVGVVPHVVRDESTARVVSAHRLVCVAGPDLGRTFRIETPTVMIGRGPVDIALNAKDVSRHHARIFRRGSEYAIEDVGSSNKTFVNGRELRGSIALHAGDRVQVGATVFVFAHHDELEDRMHQLQRLEALATLAGGLAHDFNNALAVILGGLELLERKLEPADDLHDMVQEMRGAATSASSLAQRLLRLGRSAEPLAFEPVQLSPLILRTVTMMRRQLAPEIKIELDIAPELVIRGSQEELNQVLVNLIVNARDAMPKGGTLSITARGVLFDTRQAVANQLPARGDYVELTVTDTGVGMDDATLARAFEPFFTTKPPGQGTGLGLAMIHGIVRRHGGTIVTESVVGHGTTFRIWLSVG